MSKKQADEIAPVVRLTSIELNHFKNVAHGRIDLSSWKPGERIASDIIGIYGQNGSGKTSVVLAFMILQKLFMGSPLPGFVGECLEAGRDSLSIIVSGLWGNRFGKPHACSIEEKGLFSYTVEIARRRGGLVVKRERLALKVLQPSESSFRTLFDYFLDEEDDGGFALKPKTQWEGLFGPEPSLGVDLALAQRMSVKEGSSFLFSNAMFSLLCVKLDAIYDSYSKGERAFSRKAAKAFGELYPNLRLLVLSLTSFSYKDMAVVTTTRQAGLSLNVLRISTHEGETGCFADNSFQIDISKPYLATKDQLDVLEPTVSTVSTVLAALVPGLSFCVERLGSSLTDEGELAERVELVVSRGNTVVPLRSESEGVKKLVAILVMLIDVYSKPGAFVAIDELDSGLFEFLLGEILQVLQEHGRGQLVFTAHNLRPLETLDKGSLVFTTTNPNNRYTTFKGSGATNNLRSQYLRAINLGGQPETIYEPTSKFEIDSAFYDAGCAVDELR